MRSLSLYRLFICSNIPWSINSNATLSTFFIFRNNSFRNQNRFWKDNLTETFRISYLDNHKIHGISNIKRRCYTVVISLPNSYKMTNFCGCNIGYSILNFIVIQFKRTIAILVLSEFKTRFFSIKPDSL